MVDGVPKRCVRHDAAIPVILAVDLGRGKRGRQRATRQHMLWTNPSLQIIVLELGATYVHHYCLASLVQMLFVQKPLLIGNVLGPVEPATAVQINLPMAFVVNEGLR